MTINCKDCPLRQLSAFEPFKKEEIDFMNRFKTGQMEVQPGTHLLVQASKSPQLFTVLSGMGLRYKSLENGERQVINFVFPGDFIGLQAGIMGEMGHSVEATTSMTLCVFNRADIWSLFRSLPDRAYALTHLAAVEEHFLGDALATIGQKSALEKVAWALCQIFTRSAALDLLKNDTCPFPYKQQDLADALGLSLVHTNKTLGRLREEGVLLWKDGNLTIYDRHKLGELASIDTSVPIVRPLM
ncbi:Crp/Fnr family transcriptional regulator [Roseovarius aestuariivivens]|uniref:Crp/Fnr family transcriptional regulator n=1 Tax=Roseovarius aestuariivivens TaxID=1888910 RepID=UPI0010810E1B|nr:Crp/Fnr family transcriptional regulator [Roseovarius aestuariivivens]